MSDDEVEENKRKIRTVTPQTEDQVRKRKRNEGTSG